MTTASSGWVLLTPLPGCVAFLTSYAAIPEHTPTDPTRTLVTIVLGFVTLLLFTLGIRGVLASVRHRLPIPGLLGTICLGLLFAFMGVLTTNEGGAIEPPNLA